MSAEVKLTDEVRDALKAALVVGPALKLSGKLDRQVYQRVAKAIELLGGKWNLKAGCHVFEDDAEAVVADAISTGLVVDAKKYFQFFETPPDVAAVLVEHADLGTAHRILEPSAGKGAIIRAIRAVLPKADVAAYELWDKNVAELRKLGLPVIAGDFLLQCDVTFDRIVMNPPFTRGQDVDHVVHAWNLLNAGGRIASVMAESWRFHGARKYVTFRDFVERQGGEWHPLPEGAFAPSGTNVRAGILVLDRGTE